MTVRRFASGIARLSVAVIGLLATIAVSPVSIHAQDQDSLMRTLRRAQNSAWILRSVLTSGDTVLGRPRLLSADAAQFGSDRVELMNISYLERRQVTGSAALLGALVGSIFLGAVGHGLSGLCDSGACRDKSLVTTAIGVGAGGVLGAFAGTAISPGRESWTPVWRR
jgi:hypothetical protein